MTDSDIVEFWRWFRATAPILEQDFGNDALLEELADRVHALADISWEIGPGTSTKCALVLTPDGARRLLPTTQRIVAMAPSVPNWEFHAARPPKQWKLKFSLEIEGRLVAIDASPWRYLRVDHAGETEVVVEQHNLPGISDDDRYTASTIVLDGVLGEERRLSAFDRVHSTYELTPEQRSASKPITELAADTIATSSSIS